MKKINKTPLAAAMGAAFISTFAATAANAEANPFGLTELSTGYMQVAAADTSAKTAEMPCGAAMGGMTKPKAAGDASTKTGEMPCGAAMGGMTKPKTAEGKCAGMKKPAAPAKTTEGSMMKGKEGASGDKMNMPATPATPAK